MNSNVAVQDRLVADVMAVILRGVVQVLVDDIAVEVDTGEDTLVARVGEEACVRELRCGGLRIAAYGTSGYADVRAKLDLVMQKPLRGIMRGGYKNERGGLAASLEAETCASELDECGSAPAMAGAAGDDTLTILGADEKGALLESGNDGDAGRMHRDAIGNAAIGRGHQLVENFVGGLDALVKLGLIGGMRGEGRRCKQDDTG